MWEYESLNRGRSRFERDACIISRTGLIVMEVRFPAAAIPISISWYALPWVVVEFEDAIDDLAEYSDESECKASPFSDRAYWKGL